MELGNLTSTYVLHPPMSALSLFQGDGVMEYGVIPEVNLELIKERKTRGS